MRLRLIILLTLAHAASAAGDAIPAPGRAAADADRAAGSAEPARPATIARSAGDAARNELRFLPSRDVVLTYAVDDAVPVDAVELWFRRSANQPWAPVEFEAMRPGSLTYKAPDDGASEFYLILRNAGGASAPPPSADAVPHARVLVDTVAPAVQIHRAQVRSLAAMDRRLSVELTATDEHLGPAGVRLFYRPADAEPPSKSPNSTESGERTESPDPAAPGIKPGTKREAGLRSVFSDAGQSLWRDGGAVEMKDGAFKWPLPDNLPDTLDMRVVVTDLAGNQAADELRYVPTVLVSPHSEPAGETGDVAKVESADDGRVARVDRVEVPLVTPVGTTADDQASAAPAESPADTSRDAESGPADAAAKAASEDARRLAEIAARHLRAREYDLAAARFRDGLKLIPNDPDLLTGLGGVLYRMEQFDDATAQFASALLAEPDHIGALEGYALVDATQRRYPEARKRLGQLLRLQPRSARHWLHFGDIEHKLGNTREALEAWRKTVDLENAPPEIVEQGRKRLKYFDTSRRP